MGHAKRKSAFASIPCGIAPRCEVVGRAGLNSPQTALHMLLVNCCGELHAVCCVLCAVCCVLCAVCCVLCAVCCVLCAVCCVLCAVCRVPCADLLGCACACCDSQENLPKRAKPGWCPSGQKPPRPPSSRGGFRQGEVQLGANRFSVATGTALRTNQPRHTPKPHRINEQRSIPKPCSIKCRTPARHPTRGQSASGSTSVQTPQ
ncbi:MAG: hypothetical protein C0422_15340 [Alcaligenaceae bacterium]|nr:hypothetical protein [Alcaligenaceae bacterium]